VTIATIGKAAPADQVGSGFAVRTTGLTLRLYRKLKRAATKMAAEGLLQRSPSAASPVKSLLGASPTALSHSRVSPASSVGCEIDALAERRGSAPASFVAADGGRKARRDPKDRVITVCSACLCASCWHGEFMCQESGVAGTVEKTVRELDALGREHRSNYSVSKVTDVCGDAGYRDGGGKVRT
jgi:hypothetical protein